MLSKYKSRGKHNLIFKKTQAIQLRKQQQYLVMLRNHELLVDLYKIPNYNYFILKVNLRSFFTSEKITKSSLKVSVKCYLFKAHVRKKPRGFFFHYIEKLELKLLFSLTLLLSKITF